MKIKTYATITILSLLLFSCSNVLDNLINFDAAASTSFTFPTVPAVPSGFPNQNLNLPYEFTTPEINSNLNEQAGKYSSHINLITKIKLKGIVLTIDPNANLTFSFLKSIHLYISTNTNPEIELAYLDNINSNSNTITLIPTSNDLVNHIKASSYKIRAAVVLNSIPANLTNTTIKNDMIFTISAKPF